MTKTIEKTAEEHSAAEMMKRDGETYMAVGLFILALSIPVLIGTIWALDRPHAAVVNATCGAALAVVGGGAIAYGWKLFKRATS
ncbi:MAG: hypothetical protein IT364_05105 [Candidatus Hydrogenedentes bacterium]|nr:hypothetical protein [Candidatus Hydrogenedentota bacterium]